MSFGLRIESDESRVAVFQVALISTELFELFVLLPDEDGGRVEVHLLADEPQKALLPGGSFLGEDESVRDVSVRVLLVVMACMSV